MGCPLSIPPPVAKRRATFSETSNGTLRVKILDPKMELTVIGIELKFKGRYRTRLFEVRFVENG